MSSRDCARPSRRVTRINAGADRVTPAPAPRRILVAVDGSPELGRALEIAAHLAARLRSELYGVFVEDIELLQLARLPFARELAETSATLRGLDHFAMERALRAQGERLRRRIATAAEHGQVPWSFRVVRGEFVEALVAATPEADLLLIFSDQHAWRQRHTGGSTLSLVTARATCNVCVLSREVALERPVVVAFDGSVAGTRALHFAARLSEGDEELVVLLCAVDPDDAARLRELAARELHPWDVAPRFGVVSAGSLDRVVAAVRSEGGRLLVLAMGSWLGEQDAESLARRVAMPVVLAR